MKEPMYNFSSFLFILHTTTTDSHPCAGERLRQPEVTTRRAFSHGHRYIGEGEADETEEEYHWERVVAYVSDKAAEKSRRIYTRLIYDKRGRVLPVSWRRCPVFLSCSVQGGGGGIEKVGISSLLYLSVLCGVLNMCRIDNLVPFREDDGTGKGREESKAVEDLAVVTTPHTAPVPSWIRDVIWCCSFSQDLPPASHMRASGFGARLSPAGSMSRQPNPRGRRSTRRGERKRLVSVGMPSGERASGTQR